MKMTRVFAMLVAVACVTLLSATAEAQLPKQGTVTGTAGFTGIGEAKEVGPNRVYWSGVYWGTSFNDNRQGPLHDSGWYCTGVNEIINGNFRGNGDCTVSDMDGDKIFLSWREL